MTAKDYWKQYVMDYIDCATDCEGENYTEKDLNNIVDNLMNNDHLWTEIDSYVEEEINWYRKEKK